MFDNAREEAIFLWLWSCLTFMSDHPNFTGVRGLDNVLSSSGYFSPSIGVMSSHGLVVKVRHRVIGERCHGKA